MKEKKHIKKAVLISAVLMISAVFCSCDSNPKFDSKTLINIHDREKDSITLGIELQSPDEEEAANGNWEYRYYIDLSETFDAGNDQNSIKAYAYYDEAEKGSQSAAVQITEYDKENHIYYIPVKFSPDKKKPNNSTGVINNDIFLYIKSEDEAPCDFSNDYSFSDVEGYAASKSNFIKVKYSALFNNGNFVFGSTPDGDEKKSSLVPDNNSKSDDAKDNDTEEENTKEEQSEDSADAESDEKDAEEKEEDSDKNKDKDTESDNSDEESDNYKSDSDDEADDDSDKSEKKNNKKLIDNKNLEFKFEESSNVEVNQIHPRFSVTNIKKNKIKLNEIEIVYKFKYSKNCSPKDMVLDCYSIRSGGTDIKEYVNTDFNKDGCIITFDNDSVLEKDDVLEMDFSIHAKEWNQNFEADKKNSKPSEDCVLIRKK